MEPVTTSSPTPVWQIVYVSTAVQRFDQVHLRQIAEASQRNNRDLEVTGILMYRNRTFMQFLEAPNRSVGRTLLEKIKRDQRHYKLDVIRDGLIPQRQFNGWCMRIVHQSDLDSPLGAVSEKLSMLHDASHAVSEKAKETLFIMRGLWT